MAGSALRAEERSALLPAVHGSSTARPALRQVLHRRHNNLVEKFGGALGAPQGGLQKITGSGSEGPPGKMRLRS